MRREGQGPEEMNERVWMICQTGKNESPDCSIWDRGYISVSTPMPRCSPKGSQEPKDKRLAIVPVYPWMLGCNWQDWELLSFFHGLLPCGQTKARG